jgi:Ni,Fe-hydrogenase III small subunit
MEVTQEMRDKVQEAFQHVVNAENALASGNTATVGSELHNARVDLDALAYMMRPPIVGNPSR